MTFKKIKIPLYRDEVWVLVCPFDAALHQLDKWGHGIAQDLSDCGACTIFPPNKPALIWTPCIKGNFAEFGHEVIHAAMYVLRRAGVKVDVENHEALTYLFTFICDELHI